MGDQEDVIRMKYDGLAAHLDERTGRLWEGFDVVLMRIE